MLKINISVRNLVEFICRSGSIDSTSEGLRDPNLLQDGIKAHQNFQKKQTGDYSSEVVFNKIFLFHYDVNERKDFSIEVSGRADGIFTDKDSIRVTDEIKSTYRSLKSIEEPVPVHLAQAMCYAAMLAENEDLSRAGVRIVYINLRSKREKYFTRVKDRGELENWFSQTVSSYASWCIWQFKHITLRNMWAYDLKFPFPYRDGQFNLIKGVYQSILRNKRLFIEAPTGVGKTLSTIFPGIMAMSRCKVSKIFYLTAKTITRTVASDTAELLNKSGDGKGWFKAVVITARDKICPLEKPVCDRSCMYANGHYDRINEAILDMINSENVMTPETVLRFSSKYLVCPYYLALDAAWFCDMVICDYNYVFDPVVSLERFFGTEAAGSPDVSSVFTKYISEYESEDHEVPDKTMLFLVDEAHNLVQRACDMYSAVIDRKSLVLFRKLLKKLEKEKNLKKDSIQKLINSSVQISSKCIKKLSSMDLKGDYDYYGADLPDEKDINILSSGVKDLVTSIEKLLGNTDFRDFIKKSGDSDELMNFYFYAGAYYNASLMLSKRFRVYMTRDAQSGPAVSLRCMEPDEILDGILESARCTCFFSATLLPVNFFRQELGGRKEDYAIYAPSPFASEKRLVLAAGDVSTKYKMRTADEYEKIAAYLHIFISAKPGNYMFFFSSYKMMNDILEIFSSKYGNDTLINVQRPDMKEPEREEFLARFKKNDRPVTGFCILGGIFSEGIDLTGESLIGAAIVGPGLPMVCTENEIYKDYFDEKNSSGFECAYRIPGMNKVTQAGGRVIRTENDRGVILLLDRRFLQDEYRRLFPEEWKPCRTVNSRNLAEVLENFWEAGHEGSQT